MINEMNVFVVISVIITSFLITSGFEPMFNVANGQRPFCDNGVIMSKLHSNNVLPVILIHGYKENSKVWSTWEKLLHQNSIPYCTLSFQQSVNPFSDYDACGSAMDHAKDISHIVQQVKSITGKYKVNIVGYSKGGLDSRVYLANNSKSSDVANLIMIGTPNAGDLLADITLFDTCTPAALDLTSNADDTKAAQNVHTNYYTIAGTCSSFPIPNDGLVSESSVESLSYAKALSPNPSDCHLNLLQANEFDLAKPILNKDNNGSSK